MKKAKAFGFSDIGNFRPTNEDAWLSLPEKYFFALADGMGGHNAGEIASKEAIAQIELVIEKFSPYLVSKQLVKNLKKVITNANLRVWDMGRQNNAYKGMGTTLCVLCLHKDSAIYAHVGDSRIYRYRQKEIKRLTEDHILVSSKERRVLTKAIGTSSTIEPSIASASAIEGDIFLLCSDGLSDFVLESEMEEILKNSRSLKKAVFRLIEKAKEKGSNDNITLLMVKICNERKNLFRQQRNNSFSS